MAKFKEISRIVEAEPYHFGLESGFIDGNRYIPADGGEYPEDARCKEYTRYHYYYRNDIEDAITNPETFWKPYIDTDRGFTIVNPTDMIVTKDNKRFVLSKEEFYNNYKPLT